MKHVVRNVVMVLQKKIVLIIYLYHMMWTLSYGLISPRFKLEINQLRKQ